MVARDLHEMQKRKQQTFFEININVVIELLMILLVFSNNFCYRIA